MAKKTQKFEYESAYSIASGNYNQGKNYYYNLDEFYGPIIDFDNKTFTCTYDAD